MNIYILWSIGKLSEKKKIEIRLNKTGREI